MSFQNYILHDLPFLPFILIAFFHTEEIYLLFWQDYFNNSQYWACLSPFIHSYNPVMFKKKKMKAFQLNIITISTLNITSPILSFCSEPSNKTNKFSGTTRLQNKHSLPVNLGRVAQLLLTLGNHLQKQKGEQR